MDEVIPLLSAGAAIVVLLLFVPSLLSRRRAMRVVAAEQALQLQDERDGGEPSWPRELVPIATVEGGAAVLVSGRIRPRAEPLRAPLSKRACVYYEATIDEATGGGRARAMRWKNRHRERRHCDFVVVDASGEARVRARRDQTAFLDVPVDHEEPHGGPRDAYTRRRGLEIGRLPGAAADVSVREAIIAEGDVVEVWGRARREKKNGALVIEAVGVAYVRARDPEDA